MIFKSNLRMKSHPDLTVKAKISPLTFCASMMGSLDASVDTIRIEVGQIPIRLAIPFLKSRKGTRTVACVGGFDIKVKPFTVRIANASLAVDGVVGKEGIRADLDSRIKCETEMAVSGNLAGKLGTFTLALDEKLDADACEIES